MARALKRIGCIPASSGIPSDNPFPAIRNAIEHMDERIEDGCIDSLESPMCLLLTDDLVRIARVELPYAKLAASIKQLCDLTTVLTGHPRV